MVCARLLLISLSSVLMVCFLIVAYVLVVIWDFTIGVMLVLVKLILFGVFVCLLVNSVA